MDALEEEDAWVKEHEDYLAEEYEQHKRDLEDLLEPIVRSAQIEADSEEDDEGSVTEDVDQRSDEDEDEA